MFIDREEGAIVDGSEDPVIRTVSGEIRVGSEQDIIRMVDLGLLDVALARTAIVEEHGPGEFRVLSESGFFNHVLCLIGSSRAPSSIRRVVSPYPRLARRFFGSQPVIVIPVGGETELYAKIGDCDAGVGLCRSGWRAKRHDLRILDVIASSSLCVLVNSRTTHNQGGDFAQAFLDWLATGSAAG
jgi:ATP phosphoribosyltransferase